MSKQSDLVSGILWAIIFTAIILIISTWFTMIGLGILHAHFIAAIPPLGWSGAFWTNIGITFLLGGRSTGISVKKD